MRRRLWFSILGPPTAWTLAELVGVASVRAICTTGNGPAALATWQWLLLLGIPVAAAIIAAAGLLVGVGSFCRTSGGMRFLHAEGVDRVQFMAMAGIIISSFLLLNIIYFGVMPVIVDPCLRTT